MLIIILMFVKYVIGEPHSDFNEWEIKYRVMFSQLNDANFRANIIMEAEKKVAFHNSNPNVTYKLALNEYSHISGEEFIQSKCGTKLPKRLSSISLFDNFNGMLERTFNDTSYIFGNYTPENAPNSTNFSYLMLSVVNQKNCNACWAFASLAQIEGMLRYKNPKFKQSLSPQLLIDCDNTNKGCSGGWPSNAMFWLKSKFGGANKCSTSSAYPYKGIEGKCKKDSSKIFLSIRKVNEIYYGGNELLMKAHIANYGPTVVGTYITKKFQFYSSGVIYDASCPSGSVCKSFNHAVVIVGYGTDPILGDYWLAKNSWGSNWGENGYVRLARNMDNNCNVACYAISASINNL